MGDLFADAAAWVGAQLGAFYAIDVTYVRGENSVALRAVRGRTGGSRGDAHHVREEFNSDDFLIFADQLVLGGFNAVPQPGDLIRYQNAADITVQHQVLPPEDSEACWRYSDPQRTRMRIHTKEIDSSVSSDPQQTD